LLATPAALLGAKLFNELKKESAIAAGLSDDLCSLFEENFEKGMDKLWDGDPVKVTPLQIDIARYFTKFKIGENNLYRLLIQTVKKSKKKATFSTTNYDLLLEQAINAEGFLISYTGLPVEKDNLSLLKIHGSCNFIPAIKPDQIKGIGFVVPKDGTSILNAPVRPTSAEEAKKFCDEADAIAPAIAVYSEGKQVLHCDKFVKEQQAQWEAAIKKASKIFVIGLRVIEHDDHIWGVLSKNKAWLGYVGLEPKEFTEWSNKVGRKNSYIVSDTFENSISVIERRLKL